MESAARFDGNDSRRNRRAAREEREDAQRREENLDRHGHPGRVRDKPTWTCRAAWCASARRRFAIESLFLSRPFPTGIEGDSHVDARALVAFPVRVGSAARSAEEAR